MLLPVLFSNVFLGNFTQQNLSGSSAISLYLGGGYPSLKKKKKKKKTRILFSSLNCLTKRALLRFYPAFIATDWRIQCSWYSDPMDVPQDYYATQGKDG